MKEKKQKRLSSEARRIQIIEKATKSFSQNGYEKTTIVSLANSCGITEPALYRYFSSKEELFAEVLKALKNKIDITSLTEEVEKLNDIEEILFAISMHIFQTYLKNPELSRLLLYCSLKGHDMTKRVVDTLRVPYITILRQSLDRLKKNELIQPVNTIITASCFTGMVTECVLGINLWKGMQGGDFKAEEIMKNNVPIFARGLRKQ
ncbi:MAG: TetR/AcrR family transcriptional regulator [candidate division Zixibacteria bacterium]|nr:TetR/AcrR family transcriptional regulator [candidate division Zixibacteria bacterium]